MHTGNSDTFYTMQRYTFMQTCSYSVALMAYFAHLILSQKTHVLIGLLSF